MAKVLVNDTSLTDIAAAIREKNGTSETYKPSEMGDAVRAIQTGGGGGGSTVETCTVTITNTDGVAYDLMYVGLENGSICTKYIYVDATEQKLTDVVRDSIFSILGDSELYTFIGGRYEGLEAYITEAVIVCEVLSDGSLSFTTGAGRPAD